MKAFKNYTMNNLCGKAEQNSQKGVVLFFALIALVVMSLAAVALIRSVDTNSMIAGNLSFKQSTLISADRGAENAITWLLSRTTVNLESDDAANGYYATSNGVAKTLADASTPEAAADSEGNIARFAVQRMCNATGPATSANCLFSPPHAIEEKKTDAMTSLPQHSLIYRITSAVAGPKGTVSYIQSFVY